MGMRAERRATVVETEGAKVNLKGAGVSHSEGGNPVVKHRVKKSQIYPNEALNQ